MICLSCRGVSQFVSAITGHYTIGTHPVILKITTNDVFENCGEEEMYYHLIVSNSSSENQAGEFHNCPMQ